MFHLFLLLLFIFGAATAYTIYAPPRADSPGIITLLYVGTFICDSTILGATTGGNIKQHLYIRVVVIVYKCFYYNEKSI